MNCLSSLLISNVSVHDSRTLSIAHFGLVIIGDQNRRACGVDILPAQHRRLGGIIRQFSMVWEIALDRRDSVGMCWANLAQPAQGPHWLRLFLEWRDPTFPGALRAALAELWRNYTMWNQFIEEEDSNETSSDEEEN